VIWTSALLGSTDEGPRPAYNRADQRLFPRPDDRFASVASQPTSNVDSALSRERRKANGQFGVKRTVVSVISSGLEQRWRVEAMSKVDV